MGAGLPLMDCLEHSGKERSSQWVESIGQSKTHSQAPSQWASIVKSASVEDSAKLHARGDRFLPGEKGTIVNTPIYYWLAIVQLPEIF
jgi:hypothetical protein